MVATPGSSGSLDDGTAAMALILPALICSIVDKLYGAVASILSKPEMKEMLARQMLTVTLSKSPQECTEQVQKETKEWGDFIRENKIKVE